MKKIIFLLLCQIAFSNGYSQVKEKVIKNHELKITEKLSVLISDKHIRQGAYEKYLENPNNNKSKLIEKGQYENNKKVGVWTYYDKAGKITLQYCFDNDSVMVYNDILQIDGLKVDRPLLYLGSRDEILHICNWGIRLTPQAQMLGQSGKIIVEILVSEKGEVVEYQIKKGINALLDEEALRVAKLIPKNWLPAISNGEPLKFSYKIPFTIALLGVINKTSPININVNFP